MKKPFLNSYTLGAGTILLILLLYLLPFSFIDQLELKTLDLRFKSFQKFVPSDKIVIVAIDNKSEDSIGRWPWERKTIARAVDNLSNWGAKVIGMDLIFAEKEPNPVHKIPWESKLRGMVPKGLVQGLESELDNDRYLALSLKRAQNVVMGYYFFTEGKEAAKESGSKRLTDSKTIITKSLVPVVTSRIEKEEKFLCRQGFGAETSIPELGGVCQNCGFLNIFQDDDGVMRKAALVMKESEDWYLSFPLQIIKSYSGISDLTLTVSDYGIRALQIDKLKIPVDTSGQLLIDYKINPNSFPTYSFVDVLNGAVDPRDFRDKIVLIGITDPGLIRDSWTTPVRIAVPGIKIHAQTIDTILNKRFIRYSGQTDLFNMLAVVILGLVLTFAIPKLPRAIHGTGLTAALFLGYAWTGFFLFQKLQVWINLVYPFVCILFTYTGEMLYRTIITEKKTRQIKSAFQAYVPSQVVDELVKNPERLRLGGEKRVVSVLFSDIKGFSTISERLAPEELVELINNYFTPITESIFKYEGTLDKYIGDAVMAFFGAPLPQEDHPLRAVLAALEMVRVSRVLQEKWRAEGKPVFEIGIGINTGEVLVGNMGSRMRFNYTVMGDNVNVAQRLEELTRTYQNSILISESTYNMVKEDVLCREVDTTVVKGREEPVRIYEPLYLLCPEALRR